MENRLPVGSVVKFGEDKALILGAFIGEVNGRMALCYDVVKYPVGYVDAESMVGFPASEITEVLFRGYESPKGEEYNEAWLKLHEDLFGEKPEDREAILKKQDDKFNAAVKVLFEDAVK